MKKKIILYTLTIIFVVISILALPSMRKKLDNIYYCHKIQQDYDQGRGIPMSLPANFDCKIVYHTVNFR